MASNEQRDTSIGQNRRQFLGRLGGATAAAVAAGNVIGGGVVEATDFGSLSANRRRNAALRVRLEAAWNEWHKGLAPHPTNNDDELYPTIASHGKALPHNALGEVDGLAYHQLVRAMKTGDQDDFNTIPLGGTAKLANPQAAFAFDLNCADSHRLGIKAAPAFASAWRAGEAREVYWQALTRDVPFDEYESNPLTMAAAADLSASSDFRGPKVGGKVTTATLFRGQAPGDLVGPYLSQFLWLTAPYGTTPIVQTQRNPVVGNDHMTLYDDWLNVQRGGLPAGSNVLDTDRRYIRTARDLAEWLRVDFTYQGVLNAYNILIPPSMNAPRDASNPYSSSAAAFATQAGQVTFGATHILDLLAHATNAGLRAVWYQKWAVHRTLRPEAFGGRIHNHKMGMKNYPIHGDILNSPVLDAVFQKFGTYLLPQAYTGGSPTHPSYPGGHSGFAGAGVTMLKAFFDESFVIPSPMVPDPADPTKLVAYVGPPLTVGGELNKLASNIALGRDAAGIHWRSDGIEGLQLGEQVAISMLRNYSDCFNEPFEGYSLTKFDGTTITV